MDASPGTASCSSASTSSVTSAATAHAEPARTVVVVNGDHSVIDLLDDAFDIGRWEMHFIDGRDRAHSRIRRIQPDLVILCTGMDDTAGFQLLTMLKVDPATRAIPVLTCASDHSEPEAQRETSRSETDELPALLTRSAPRMN
jgi:CheY-like chemotaxis protein